MKSVQIYQKAMYTQVSADGMRAIDQICSQVLSLEAKRYFFEMHCSMDFGIGSSSILLMGFKVQTLLGPG